MLSCLEQSLCAIYGSVTMSTLTTGKGGAKEELAYFRYLLNQDVLRSFIDLGSFGLQPYILGTDTGHKENRMLKNLSKPESLVKKCLSES